MKMNKEYIEAYYVKRSYAFWGSLLAFTFGLVIGWLAPW